MKIKKLLLILGCASLLFSSHNALAISNTVLDKTGAVTDAILDKTRAVTDSVLDKTGAVTDAMLETGAVIDSVLDKDTQTSGDVSPDKVTEALEIRDPWARASMSSIRNSAAYMTIKNLTNKDWVLISASSMDIANNVELHKSFVDEKGVSRMSSIDRLVIPAKTTVTMDPGGIHIMLMNLKSTLNVGDKINIDLRFEGHDPISVPVEVK